MQQLDSAIHTHGSGHVFGVALSYGKCRLNSLSAKNFARPHSSARDRVRMPERIVLAIRKAQVSNPHRANGNSKLERVREPNRTQTGAPSPHLGLGSARPRFWRESISLRPGPDAEDAPLLGAAVRVCARGHMLSVPLKLY